MLMKTRNYKEIMLLFTQDIRIEGRDEPQKVQDVLVETYLPVKFPPYCAQNVNILA